MKKQKVKHIGLIIVILFATLIVLVNCSPEKEQTRAQNNQEERSLQGNLGKIQGKWQSDEDELSVIEIKNDQFISYYDNKSMGTETIEFINDADERKADPNGEYFIVKGEFDAMIYFLVQITETTFEYSYTGRGNTLCYSKIE